MADDSLDYQKMTQNALRGVVRTALEVAAKRGLPGEHHFYVAFSTGAPGVVISSRLRERYPEEMTIVLQHQYWGLEVFQDRFQVKLSFNNTPETLVIPFAAVKGFLDPSVQFGLQFATGAASESAPAATPKPAEPEAETPEPETDADADADTPDKTGAAGEAAPAAVVSLDAFRKK